MAETKLSLDDWLARVKTARSTDEMWKILDAFRQQDDWIAQERQQVFHTYMRVLNNLNKPDDTASSGKKKNAANEGPVWYEKM